ncbi:MAG: hypothetical protein IJU84_08480 [Clostridia bacterium]|nr:hypothetical protein [Clostridia bacterium]
MKKAIFLLLALTLALFFTSATAFADTTSAKTVDGNNDRWEQESTRADTLATMTWDPSADTLHFIGNGYADRQGMKFGFRSNIAFSNTEAGAIIKFPKSFPALRNESNNMHFVVAYVNTWKAWWNSSDNITKSAAFIIRPVSNDTVTVELAGRWAQNSGYGDLSSVKVAEYSLGETRTLEFSLKKDSEGIVTAYVNGAEHGRLDLVLSDGKTMSDYISAFNDGKGYLQFGATLENDAEGLPLEFTLTGLIGATDAFKKPATKPDDTAGEVISQENARAYVKNAGDFNWNYVTLYGASGVLGVSALVFFLLSIRGKAKG